MTTTQRSTYVQGEPFVRGEDPSWSLSTPRVVVERPDGTTEVHTDWSRLVAHGTDGEVSQFEATASYVVGPAGNLDIVEDVRLDTRRPATMMVKTYAAGAWVTARRAVLTLDPT